MTKPKVTKKVEKETEKVEPVEPVERLVVVTKKASRPVVKAAPVVIDEHVPANDAAALQAMLDALKLADAKARLEQAKEAGNPDTMIACMDEINKLENE